MYKRARLGMGYLSQEPSIFQRLTCEQNLLAILETTGLRRHERASGRPSCSSDSACRTRLIIWPVRAAAANAASSRSPALVTDPKLILLDEPFSGVDPIAVEDLQAEIRRLAHDHGPGQEGIAFLITDHNVQQTLRVCDRSYILDSGRKLAEGTPKQLINDEMVKRAYLGSLFRGDEFDHLPERRAAVNGTK